MTRVNFPCQGLQLEGILHLPGEGSFPGVVVCHPHPLYGGDMGNNVVLALCEALVDQSIIALRFNFRGVGGSGGDFAHGVGEREDVKAALSFLASVADRDRLGLAGYSFGAMVAMPVAPESDIKALACISPPGGLEYLHGFAKPKLFISGDSDPFVPSSSLQNMARQLPPPTEVEIIPQADHLWWGQEGIVACKVAPFFARNL